MNPTFPKLAAAIATAFVLASVASRGEEMKAYAAHSVTLDSMHGTLYFAPKGGAYDLVATFDEEPKPLRIVTTLQAGQRIEMSSPAAVDAPASVVEVRRGGDRVVLESRPRPAEPISSPGEADILSGP